MNTTFQRPEVAAEFVTERRKGIPYGEDKLLLMLCLIEHYRPSPRRVVDLGCGGGIVARTILSANPDARALLVDHSQPMLEQAARDLAELSDRVDILEGDLDKDIRDLPGVVGADVIASAYAIHHLPDERKRSLYAEIYDALAPGGLFVNIEHVKPVSPRAEHLYDLVFIQNLAHHSGRSVHHVAAEYHSRPDKADNILAPVEDQTAWLREIGFIEVDCFFKILDLAVFGGVKPNKE
ncbi:MAG: class I SAM-dependent methyltransferase [Capsulimonadaceae bacterium]